MKNFCLLFLFSLASITSYSQVRYAYLPEGKATFQTSSEKILVNYKAGANLDNLKNYVSDASKLSPAFLVKWNVFSLKKDLANYTSLVKVLNELKKDSNLVYATPFLIYKDGTLQGLTNQVIVRLKTSTTLSSVNSIYARLHILSIEKDPYIQREFLLTINNRLQPDALDIANTLYETGFFEFSEPDFVKIGVFSTADPVYNTQWALQNTGQYHGTAGADINVNPAWALSTGTGIRTAVIDEGVDLNQPDLIANLLPGYDALNLGSNGGPSGDDAHGTACAGIIAAIANNNVGAAGVAYNSRIIPVRAGQNEAISTSSATTGINWAASTTGGNADILSCSWGGGSSSSSLNTAISNAATAGRGGLGCLIFFSSGNNNNSSISYPSSLSNVIAVGGTNMCDQRFVLTPAPAPNTCNYDTRFNAVVLAGGSNYGTGLGIVAPGINIATTDISGAAGLSNVANQGWQMFDQNTVLNFDGTSAACPFAAGTMALMLSANPNLTTGLATAILESTAAKVGGYNYSTTLPNGTWNNEMGYGRINACAAVSAAVSSNTYTITGSSTLCSNSANYTINTNLPVTWSVSPCGIVSPCTATGQQVTLTKQGNGIVTLTATIPLCNGTRTVTKQIFVGVPDYTKIAITAQGPMICPNVPVGFGAAYAGSCANTQDAITSFTWNVSPSPLQISDNGGPGPGCSGSNHSKVNIKFPSQPTQYNVRVSAQNACGTSSLSNAYAVTLSQSGCSQGMRFSVYPNPAINSITVSSSLADKLNNTSESGFTLLQIVDKLKNVVKQFRYQSNVSTAIINVSDLPDNLYVLRIFDGRSWTNQNFIIKHN